jgi:hypothetical protein
MCLTRAGEGRRKKRGAPSARVVRRGWLNALLMIDRPGISGVVNGSSSRTHAFASCAGKFGVFIRFQCTAHDASREFSVFVKFGAFFSFLSVPVWLMAHCLSLTNKVRLCERSEPQSEPFVGRSRYRGGKNL